MLKPFDLDLFVVSLLLDLVFALVVQLQVCLPLGYVLLDYSFLFVQLLNLLLKVSVAGLGKFGQILVVVSLFQSFFLDFLVLLDLFLKGCDLLVFVLQVFGFVLVHIEDVDDFLLDLLYKLFEVRFDGLLLVVDLSDLLSVSVLGGLVLFLDLLQLVLSVLERSFY